MQTGPTGVRRRVTIPSTRSHVLPRRVLGATAGIGVLALGLGTPAPARASTPRSAGAPLSYAVVGDSYSAGVGTRDEKDSCYRSPWGYAPMAAASRGWSLDYLACSGAVTAQVTVQASALKASTRLVSLTTGGNDAGFSTVMTQCALPDWLGRCGAAIDSAATTIRDSLPASLATLYHRIHAQAPDAEVVQLGYPRLFNGINCSWITFFSAGEMASMNQMADTLDAVEQQAAERAGVRFVDMRAAFTGHAVCDTTPWINDLTVPTTESFHPNRTGQVAYEQALLQAVDASDVDPAPALRVGSKQTHTRIAGSTPDTTSDAELVRAGSRLPDLASGSYLVRARRAHVSPATMRQLNADLHSGTATRVRAAWTTLHRLSATR